MVLQQLRNLTRTPGINSVSPTNGGLRPSGGGQNFGRGNQGRQNLGRSAQPPSSPRYNPRPSQFNRPYQAPITRTSPLYRPIPQQGTAPPSSPSGAYQHPHQALNNRFRPPTQRINPGSQTNPLNGARPFSTRPISSVANGSTPVRTGSGMARIPAGAQRLGRLAPRGVRALGSPAALRVAAPLAALGLGVLAGEQLRRELVRNGYDGFRYPGELMPWEVATPSATLPVDPAAPVEWDDINNQEYGTPGQVGIVVLKMSGTTVRPSDGAVFPFPGQRESPPREVPLPASPSIIEDPIGRLNVGFTDGNGGRYPMISWGNAPPSAGASLDSIELIVNGVPNNPLNAAPTIVPSPRQLPTATPTGFPNFAVPATPSPAQSAPSSAPSPAQPPPQTQPAPLPQNPNPPTAPIPSTPPGTPGLGQLPSLPATSAPPPNTPVTAQPVTRAGLGGSTGLGNSTDLMTAIAPSVPESEQREGEEIPAIPAPPVNPLVPPAPPAPTAPSSRPGGTCRNRCSAQIQGSIDQLNERLGTPPNDPNNPAGDLAIMGQLALIQQKLGAVIPGGGIAAHMIAFRTFVDKIWKVSQLDRIINALTFIGVLHNVLMLSRNVSDTLIDLTSIVLAAIGIKDENEAPIDIQEILGDQVENFLRNLLGDDLYEDTNERWKKANTVIRTASNIVWTMRSMINSVQEVIEWTAENLGKIGNALKRWGVVGERSYPWMSERVKTQDRYRKNLRTVIEGLSAVEDTADSLTQVTSEVREIQEETGELVQQTDDFYELVAGEPATTTPLDSSDVDNVAIATAEGDASVAVQAPETLEERLLAQGVES
ncbi:MAG: hypothetical protein AAGA75_07565 [Cyanobacteria bacterium P01_E01_bin.6]